MRKSWIAIASIVFLCFCHEASADEIPRLVVPTGHTDLVASVAFSPDGRYVVSGGSDRRVVVWELESGRELKSFTHSANVTSVDFAGDGKSVLGFSGNRDLKEWDVKSGSVTSDIRNVLGFPLFSKAAYIPGANAMVTAGADSLEIWDRGSGEQIGNLGEKLGILQTLAVSNSGKYVLAGGDKEKVFVFDRAVAKQLRTYSKHGDKIVAVAISPDEKVAASATFSNKIHLWRISDGKTMDKIRTKSKGIYALAFSADGQTLISGHKDGSIELRSSKTGDRKSKIEGHGKAVIGLAVDPAGRYFASASADETIKVWDARKTTLVRRLAGKSSDIVSAAFVRGGTEALIGLADNSFRMIDLERMKQIGRLADLPVVPYHAAISGEKIKILFQNYRQEAFLWDVGKNEKAMSFEDLARYSPVNTMSSDGSSFALSTSKNRLVWYDTRREKMENEFDFEESLLTGAAYSSDGRTIAAGTEEGRILLLDRKTAKVTLSMKVHDVTVSELAFSPDDALLLSGGRSGTVRLHDLGTGKLLREMKGHDDMVETLVFSPDGRTALSGGYDSKIVLWDLESGERATSFEGHGASILGAAFLIRKNRIVSASRDGVVKYWDTKTGEELASVVLCGATDWVAVTPDGLFDGTTDGILNLHYELNMKTLPLDSFYEKYYTPRLLVGILEEETLKIVDKAPSIAKGISLPPAVEILEPRTGQVLTSPDVTLLVRATPRDAGLEEIRVYHNAKLVESEERGIQAVPKKKAMERSWRLAAVAGENEIRVTAINGERIESDPAVVRFEVETKPRGADLHVLAVGINSYKNATYNLNYGKPDAEAFVKILEEKSRSIFGKIRKILVTDSDATRPSIEKAFDRVAKNSKQEDVFVFFYAGHGVMSEPEEKQGAEYFLALHDVTQLYGKHGVLKKKGLSAQDLKKMSISVPARKQLLVIDACQAGGAVEAFAFRGAAEQRAIAQLARSTGMVVIASSGTEQFASEFSQLGHGVFTYAMLRGLEGEADGGTSPDGKITIKELEAYLNDRVPELTEKYRGTPQYTNSYARGNDFPLAVK